MTRALARSDAQTILAETMRWLDRIGCPDATGQTFNVAVEPPVNFGEACAAYRRALRRLGASRWRERTLAAASAGAQGAGRLTLRLGAPLKRRYAHTLWRPGWDLTYSSARLRATGFRFTRTDFCDVLQRCLQAAALGAPGRS